MFVLIINCMFNQVNGTVGVYLCLIVVLAQEQVEVGFEKTAKLYKYRVMACDSCVKYIMTSGPDDVICFGDN